MDFFCIYGQLNWFEYNNEKNIRELFPIVPLEFHRNNM